MATRLFAVTMGEKLDGIQPPTLQRLAPTPLALERPIQRLCEQNLETLFGLEFLASEFTVRNLRIDTLSFDPLTNAYVIIEFKRGANYSVIDQGFAYLNLLQNHREAFLHKHSSVKGFLVESHEIDWHRCRVFFVSQEFTQYQRLAVELRDFSLDLYQVSFHGNSVMSLERVGSSDEAVIAEAPAASKTGFIKTLPSIEAHLDGRPNDIVALYRQLAIRIAAIGEDITERPIQVAVLFEVDGTRFAEVVPQQKQLSVHFDYFDDQSFGLDVDDLDNRGVGHLWAVGPYKVILRPGDGLDAVISLIANSYSLLKKSMVS